MLTDKQLEGGITLLIMCILSVTLITFIHFRDDKKIPPAGGWRPDALAVQVVGEVRPLGIYFVPSGSTVNDVIRLAGINLTMNRGDTSHLNTLVRNGDAIYFPSTAVMAADVSIGSMDAAKRLTLNIPLNINIASADEVAMIPGIGPKTAALIVQERNERGRFKTLERLKSIKGIKEKRLEDIRPHLSID